MAGHRLGDAVFEAVRQWICQVLSGTGLLALRRFAGFQPQQTILPDDTKAGINRHAHWVRTC